MPARLSRTEWTGRKIAALLALAIFLCHPVAAGNMQAPDDPQRSTTFRILKQTWPVVVDARVSGGRSCWQSYAAKAPAGIVAGQDAPSLTPPVTAEARWAGQLFGPPISGFSGDTATRAPPASIV